MLVAEVASLPNGAALTALGASPPVGAVLGDPAPVTGVAVFGGVAPSLEGDAPGVFTSDARSEATLVGVDDGD
jgi:hypothetical protein